MLVSDVVYTALRLAGVLTAPGRGYSESEQKDAVAAWNTMLDSWNTERLIVYQITRNVFPLSANKQVYQIGSGSRDFDTPRPPRIERAGLISLTNPAQPLELPMSILTVEQWHRDVPAKNVQSTLPLSLYYDAAYPLGNIYFWPIPTASNQVALYCWNPLTAVGELTDEVVLPPGYLAAVQYGLATELACRPWPSSVPMNGLVMQKAIDYKAAIKSLNIPITEARCDPALTGRGGIFDWRTGDSVRR